jgi:hypothetical protein
MTTSTLGRRTVPAAEGLSPRATSTIREATTPIQRNARIAGALWLLIAVIAGFVHFYVPGQLLVPGDATATATRIMASEGLFRLGMAAELALLAIEVVVAVLVYSLLKPVDRTLSLVGAALRVSMIAVHGVNVVNRAVALLLASGAGYLTVFGFDQRHALMMLFLDAYGAGFSLGMVFFGLHFFPLGYAIYKSGYFPRALGVLFLVAGAAYLVDTFSLVLVAGHTIGAPHFALPIVIAESAFPVWLLIKGVHAARWEQRAALNARREGAMRDSSGTLPTFAGSLDLRPA